MLCHVVGHILTISPLYSDYITIIDGYNTTKFGWLDAPKYQLPPSGLEATWDKGDP